MQCGANTHTPGLGSHGDSQFSAAVLRLAVGAVGGGHQVTYCGYKGPQTNTPIHKTHLRRHKVNVDEVLDGARAAHAHPQLLAQPAPRAVCRRQVLACGGEAGTRRRVGEHIRALRATVARCCGAGERKCGQHKSRKCGRDWFRYLKGGRCRRRRSRRLTPRRPPPKCRQGSG